MLRIFLPPNFASALTRDAVAVKVDLDLSAPPPAWSLPALALLQQWHGSATPPKFLQLNRVQLRQLVGTLVNQPVFFWLNRPDAPIAWERGELALGVSLTPPPAAEPVPAALPAGTHETLLGGSGTRPAAARRAAERTGLTPLLVDGSEHFLAITLPSREDPHYGGILELLKSAGFILEPGNRKWWLRDRHKTLNFLAEHGARLRERFGAEYTANFERNLGRVKEAEVRAEATEAGGGYDVTVGLHAGKATEATVREAVATQRRYIESDGMIYLVAPAQLERLAETQRALAGSAENAVATRRTHRISAAGAADAQVLLEALSPGFEPPETWRERSVALKNLSTLAPAPLPEHLDRQLRPYQRLGVAWLCHLYKNQLAGILADEMGLGKTVQALALLCALPALERARPSRVAVAAAPRDRRALGRPAGQGGLYRASPGAELPATGESILRSPALVVCPASLLENWRREAARFAPELRTVVHHGERRLREAREFAAVDVVITSYGTLARDQEIFTGLEFAVVIGDEAQHVKNRRSQNAAALRALRARGRFLLTGTPLENSLEDLRSLFEFLLPGYLDRVPPGLKPEERAWHEARLRAKTAPYILRRTKRAVAPELPAKLEQILWCELGPAQAALYRAMQEQSERELFDLEARGASEGALRLATLTQLLRLRQIACDPRLVRNTGSGRSAEAPVYSEDEPAGATSGADEAARPVGSENGEDIKHVDAEDGEEDKDISLIDPRGALEAGSKAARGKAAGEFGDSAKLEAFRELLAEAVDDGHRLLVFSQFTSLLALVRAEFDANGTSYCYLDGSMSTRARQAEVDRFQRDADVSVFLLSLKAGGTGLNLTGADTVVHLDPWWNPAVEAQATDRAHRIGQTRTVTSYKLIASGTVEEKVLALQDEKKALLADVFEASDAAAAKLSLGDLRALVAR